MQDADVDTLSPICIAMDYNANINWIVAGQYESRFINVLQSFFVKYDRKLQEVVKDFCHYYRHHMKKHVIYYYDSTALGSNYAVNDQDFATVAEKTFNAHGWTVEMVNLGNPMKHQEKHMLMDRWLKGQEGYTPRLNEENNEELIFALESTGIRVGANGFQKDKSGEKLGETEEDKLGYRTDGTDAFDTLVIGMNKEPRSVGSSFAGSFYL